MAAFPLSAASCIGITPSRFAADTFAPAAISRSAVSMSSIRTAQCRAVVPSTCGTLTSAFRCSKERTASLLPFWPRPPPRWPAAPALATDSNTTRQYPSTRLIDIW